MLLNFERRPPEIIDDHRGSCIRELLLAQESLDTGRAEKRRRPFFLQLLCG